MASAGARTLTMEKIRCFSKEKIELRPLTLLLGENSTGKSTTLGCMQTVLETFKLQEKRNWLPFNEKAHSMGGFRDLVRNLSPTATAAIFKREKVRLTYDTGPLKCDFVFGEHPKGKSAELKELSLTLHESPGVVIGSVVFKLSDRTRAKSSYNNRTNQVLLEMNDNFFSSFHLEDVLCNLLEYMAVSLNKKNANHQVLVEPVNALGKRIADNLPDFSNLGTPANWRPAERFYEIPDMLPAVGASLPVDLWALKKNDKRTWSELINQVNVISKKFDLFTDFDIVKYNGSSDRFSIVVVRDGKKVNICDLGSGVWQTLQQLIRLKLAQINRTRTSFMIQHTDIHGHPKLHAEMTSQYCRAVNDGHQFIIETHSDYVLRRISIEISKGTINHQDVALAYFTHDKSGKRCKIHNLKLDRNGEMETIPRFFMRFYFDEVKAFVESAPST